MSLIEDAKAAKEAGISCGTHMLKNKRFIGYPKMVGKRCVVCGVILHGRQQRFCTKECRKKHLNANAKGDKFV